MKLGIQGEDELMKQRRLNKNSTTLRRTLNTGLLNLSLIVSCGVVNADPVKGGTDAEAQRTEEQRAVAGGASAETDAETTLGDSAAEAGGREPTPTATRSAEAPLATAEQIGPPTSHLRDLYTPSDRDADREACKAQKGKWFDRSTGAEGCILRNQKEGRWTLSQEGKVVGMVTFKADQMEGTFYSFTPTGHVLETIEYQAGRQEGISRRWETGGQLVMVSYLKDGEKNGPYFEWNAGSCIPVIRGAFLNGLKNGPWVTRNPDGALSEIGVYEEGVKQGNWSFYHAEGNKIREGMLKDEVEEGVWREWLHTGQFWREVQFVHGVRQGEDELACEKIGGKWIVDYKEREEQCYHDFNPAIAHKQYYESGKLWRRTPINSEGVREGKQIWYHPSGEILAEVPLKHGIPDGEIVFLKRSGEPMAEPIVMSEGGGAWRAYHENGKLREQGQFLLGVKVGPWRTFYEHGGIESEITLSSMGSREGPYQSYYSDGAQQVVGQFVGNQRHGTWRFFYMNGQAAIEGEFKNGDRSGPWREWHWLSSLKLEGEYDGDQKVGLWKEYHNNGVVSAEGSYVADLKQGSWLQTWYTGAQWRELQFNSGISEDPHERVCGEFKGKWTEDLKARVAGCEVCQVTPDQQSKRVKVGSWRWWHPNGKLEKEGEFFRDLPHGDWKEYDQEGELSEEGEYHFGQRQGRWSGYFTSGTLRYRGHFNQAGEEEGLWQAYHPSGSIESSGQYHAGVRVGTWSWWSPNRELRQVGQFKRFEKILQEVETAGVAHPKESVKPQEERTGLWLSWREDCAPYTIGKYEENQREGLWRWWRADGSGWRADWYRRGRSQEQLPIPSPLSEEERNRLKTLCETSTSDADPKRYEDLEQYNPALAQLTGPLMEAGLIPSLKKEQSEAGSRGLEGLQPSETKPETKPEKRERVTTERAPQIKD